MALVICRVEATEALLVRISFKLAIERYIEKPALDQVLRVPISGGIT